MNVLSTFDGMSCGQIALNRSGIKIKNYFASEIKTTAIKTTQKNYPKTKQVGDVMTMNWFGLPKIDLFIGGSPCQDITRLKPGFTVNDSKSKLFYEYVRILNQLRTINPKIKFLLENVVDVANGESEKIITEYLGINPIRINSKLVSYQQRDRMYWTNIGGGKFNFL